MKNKKGFTLIELLAVIAILGILVVIILMNVLRIYRNAKEDAFITQVQSIYKAAEQRYMSDSLLEGRADVCYDNETNPFDLTGQEVNYFLKFNEEGKIIYIVTKDKDYKIIAGNTENSENIRQDDMGTSRTDKKYKSSVLEEDIVLPKCFIMDLPSIVFGDGSDGVYPTRAYLSKDKRLYKEDGESVLKQLEVMPKKKGHKFLGYYIPGSEDAVIDEDGKVVNENVKKLTESVILEAKWEAVEYYIEFNGNGETSGSMKSITVMYDEETTLPLNEYKKTGSIFKGWAKSKDANEEEFSDGYKGINLTEAGKTLTLYAVWEVCADGTYSDGNTNTCQKCPVGSICTGGIIEKTCAPGTYNDGSTNTCIQCPAGYSCSGGSNKEKCVANTFAEAGSSVCSPCAAGNKSDAGASACTKTKLIIRYATGGGTLKTPTTDGNATYTWSQDTNGIISRTLNGTKTSDFYVYNYGATNVNLANFNNAGYVYVSKLGYSAPDGAEWKCTSGCSTANKTFDHDVNYKVSDFCDITHKDCTVVLTVNWASCAAGTYGVANNANCQPCPVGYYCTGTTNKTACPAGTYRGTTGAKSSTECVSCAQGYTVASGSGTSESSCKMTIPAGKRVTTRGGKVENCAANTWSTQREINQTQISDCTGCPEGYGVSAGAGTSQSSCTITVPAGQRLTSANAKTFTDCLAGTYNISHTVKYGDGDSCLSCKSPYTSTNKASSCSVILVSATTVECNAATPTGGKSLSYTGNCEFKEDGLGNWRIKFLTSGTLTVNGSMNIDVFLVGRGNSGGWGASYDASGDGGTGGRGGKYLTTLNVNVNQGSYPIMIGGEKYNNVTNKFSTAFDLSTENGKNGAAGGRGDNYDKICGCNPSGYGSGRDGSKGVPAFEDESEISWDNTYYSAGGGGGTFGYGGRGSGGVTGGGMGCRSTTCGGECYGKANTGGGGGGGYSSYGTPASGGTGVVIIRNKR